MRIQKKTKRSEVKKKDDDFDDDDDSTTPPRKQPTMSSSLRKNGTRGGDKDTKSRLGKKNRVVSFDDGTFSDEEVEEEGGDDEEMLLFGTIIGSSEKSIEIDLTKCAEKMRLVLERCTRMGMSLVECARAVGSNGRYSHRKRISSKNRNGRSVVDVRERRKRRGQSFGYEKLLRRVEEEDAETDATLGCPESGYKRRLILDDYVFMVQEKDDDGWIRC